MIQTLIHAFTGTRPGSVLMLSIGVFVAVSITALWLVVAVLIGVPLSILGALAVGARTLFDPFDPFDGPAGQEGDGDAT